MKPDKPRILIVEDHIETRIMLDLALGDTFEVVAHEGATAALESVSDDHFDVCLFDISLRDEIDGLGLLERLRTLPNFANTPMVAMTALTWENSGQHLIEGGFDRFVQKPFDPERLVEMLETLSHGDPTSAPNARIEPPPTTSPRTERDKN